MTAGYGEAGADGRRAESELVAAAHASGILLAGPNGQGVVSTPSSLCAQMVAPYPPAGRIGIASQSGNIVSSFENLAAPQRGRCEPRRSRPATRPTIGVVDFLEYFANDPETTVGLGYLEGVEHGRALYERMHDAAAHQPLVLVKGGVTEQGSRAAASHTGALATDDRVFRGACRQAGVSLATTVEEGFEVAATFATQPLPAGPNTVVLTTAGGWGVLTADAITRSQLHLLELPGDLGAAIDAKLPPRWSRGNPIDLAAAETRDTIPEVLELVACHPEVDAVIFVGLGVQSNEARIMRDGAVRGGARPRPHRVLPRAPGRPLRGGRRRDLGDHRQADPVRDGAGGQRSRQPRAGGRARHRSLLRLVGTPRGAPRSSNCGCAHAHLARRVA